MDPVRPDSFYAAAKVFAEAYGRKAAELGVLNVSCLRLGTVRRLDDPRAAATEDEFSSVPGGIAGRRRRLAATWLKHADLISVVQDELASRERFRLRFGVSDNPDRFWSLEVASWDGLNVG
jgi:hypothetical protein